MTWKELVQEQMGEAEKLIDSGYKPKTGELIFFPLSMMASTLAGIADAVESINEKMDTDKMAIVKAGGTIKFFDIEDMKYILENLKEHRVRGILIDFEKNVITIMDTMEEEEPET